MEDFVTWVDTSKLKRTIMQYNDEVGAALPCAFYSGAYRFRSSTTSTCYDCCSSRTLQRARVRLALCLAVFRLLACHPSIDLSRSRRYLPPPYHPPPLLLRAVPRTRVVSYHFGGVGTAVLPNLVGVGHGATAIHPILVLLTSQVSRHLRALRPYAPPVLCLAESERYFPDVTHPTLIRKRSQASYPIGSLSTPDY